MVNKLNKVLILGSGALQIGQAGEFDYSGSQAMKALKEEGIKTVLINPNIATIQTSHELADEVYFLPVTPYFVEKVIEKEKPDGILLSFGGQTALNCGLELFEKGILKKENVEVLGTPIKAIQLTEDRQEFADHLAKIGIPTPKSHAAKNFKDAKDIVKKIGFPVMVRSGFSLGGQGSGIAKNSKEFSKIVKSAFSFVPQILIEQYLHHYKEIEYEVVRDKDDNCITVCNMENMDPLGIHTGESIVVAPSQTLNNKEYHLLREVSIKIVRSLGIVGECNVQFALNPRPRQPKGDAREGLPQTRTELAERAGGASAGGNAWQDPVELDYFVIEVNARLSRSSALASKATGYPLAYIAAKLGLGHTLPQLKNKVTGVTSACFEPSLDYIVVKIPRWDIEKFKGADEQIGSSMKSVGEVMGIGRTFEEAYQKAIRMLDLDFSGATAENIFMEKQNILDGLKIPTPKRMFAIAKALKQKMSLKRIYHITGIDPWFLYRIKNIVSEEEKLRKLYSSNEVRSSRIRSNNKSLKREQLLTLKQLGFSDKRIGELINKTGLEIRELRKKLRVIPSVFQIDTLAAEFPAKTNYLYMTYNGSHNDVTPTGKRGVIVLGSGPYRIGSSVEFDWTSVNTVLALKQYKRDSIVINCNPETVSTDYDVSSRLYFEELTFERIADIYEFENPNGIIVSVGGQTPNNRADALSNYGMHILGTSTNNIDIAEDRSKFSKLLDELKIKQPFWTKATTLIDAKKFGEKVGYPVLIRPSYVLSGSAMNICYSEDQLENFLKDAAEVSREYPVTISKFFEKAKEIEFDAVAQKGELKASIISEHIENAGVHSGDATVVLPTQDITQATTNKIQTVGKKLAKALDITGPFNIQFLAKDNEVYVIETNLRASRTFPFISKVTGINMMSLFVDCLFEKNVPSVIASEAKQSLARHSELDSESRSSGPASAMTKQSFVAIKVPQFSFSRLKGADPALRVEMASTGEVACFGRSIEEAYLKGILAVGGKIPEEGIFVSIGGSDKKQQFLESIRLLKKLNLPFYATEKTALFLKENGISTKILYKLHEKKSPSVLQYFSSGKIDLAINIVDGHVKKEVNDDAVIRRSAIDSNIPLFTKMKNARLFVKAITKYTVDDLEIKSWREYISAP